MSESTSIPHTTEERRREQSRRTEVEQVDPRPVGPLQTEKGDTTIDEIVVAKIAGIATREVPGVYAMGSATRRAFAALSERIPGAQVNVSGGVAVEKGEQQTAVDVSIIVDYGSSIVEVANSIRRNVIKSVEQSTGLEVIEVNIDVSDVHLPEDDAPLHTSAGVAELT